MAIQGEPVGKQKCEFYCGNSRKMVGRGTRLSSGYQWVSGFFGFETGSHNIDQAGLELMGYTCLCLLSAQILQKHGHHSQMESPSLSSQADL